MQDVCSKLSRLAAVVVFFTLAIGAWAQNTLPTTFYVSSGSGGQILAVNPNTVPATVTVVYSPAAPVPNFVPEDMIVGPDGNLWVCNTTSNQILRLLVDPANPTGPLSPHTVFDNSGNGATLPTKPEGCSFASNFAVNGGTPVPASLDLYFTAQAPTSGANSCNNPPCSGVWKISGAATVSTNFPDPTPVSQAFTAKAEGVEFDKFGDLLAVDQSNGQVMLGLPPNPAAGVSSFNCAGTPNCVSQFIPVAGDVHAAKLVAPTGVAVNTCHDILVADSSTSTLNRYSGDTGKFQDQLSFANKDTPRFVECDVTNNCYVVTGDETGSNSSDGKIWLVSPPAGSNQLTSCALPAKTNQTSSSGNTVKLLVDLAHLAAGQLQGNIPLSAITNALGVAVPATSITISHSFDPTTTNDYVFGHHTLRVSCPTVLKPFRLDITSVLSRPPEVAALNNGAEVTFTNPFSCASASGTPFTVQNPTCDHYASQHGFCNQYVERAFDAVSGNPIPDSMMSTYCPGPLDQGFTFWIFNQSDDLLTFPGMAHHTSPAGPVQTIADEIPNAYDECVTHDFYAIAADGTLCRSCSNSKRVYSNSSLTACQAGTPLLTLNSPIESCKTVNGVTTCNPQFNVGQNINVKATLTCSGQTNSGAVERLSIIRVQHTTAGVTTNEAVPQNVVATKNSATDNFMNVNSNGVYSYNVDSSQFDPLPKGSTAVYQFTIWGNGAVPLSFLVTGTF